MSFLRDYLTYSTGNEAPEMFHVWSGYAALSAAVSRRVWLVDGDQAIFPNVYVMLVGDAGCGKSTALRRAKRMLAELGDVPISRNVETPEGLWRFMAGDPTTNPPTPSPVAFPATWPDGQIRECHPMTIIANEFVNFISKDREGWTGALNDIYDEDKYEYRTKNKGEDLLIGPYIVILGALTTDISVELQKARIIGTGFARRCIFQYGERKFFDPHPRQTFNATEAAAKETAFIHLKKCQRIIGQFTLDPATWSWWEEWYRDHTTNIPKIATPQTKGWYTSKPAQVLKLSMLTSLSEGFDKVVSIPHLEVAISYLAEMEKDLYQVFGGFGRNELAGVAVMIHEYLGMRTTPILQRVLKSNFFSMCKPPNDFEECLKHLVNASKIAIKVVTAGTTVETIVATPEVMQKFGADHVVLAELLAQGPIELHRDALPVVGPPIAPPSPPTDPGVELPTAAVSVGETSPDLPPNPPKEAS